MVCSPRVPVPQDHLGGRTVPKRATCRRVVALVGGVLLGLLFASGTLGHTDETAGSFTISIGWQNEPAYVGELNAVYILVEDDHGQPVTDLSPDDLTVVVETAGEQSAELTFEAHGSPGAYSARLIPTVPGDYTFHVTGSIHDQPVDITVTSSDQTFDRVVEPAGIQFPARLPGLGEVATRLDRIDARIAASQANPEAQAAVDAKQEQAIEAAGAQAVDARAAADRALTAGVGIALVGLVVGTTGLIVGIRAGHRKGVASPDAT